MDGIEWQAGRALCRLCQIMHQARQGVILHVKHGKNFVPDLSGQGIKIICHIRFDRDGQDIHKAAHRLHGFLVPATGKRQPDDGCGVFLVPRDHSDGQGGPEGSLGCFAGMAGKLCESLGVFAGQFDQKAFAAAIPFCCRVVRQTGR